jgi:hypothetical protein
MVIFRSLPPMSKMPSLTLLATMTARAPAFCALRTLTTTVAATCDRTMATIAFQRAGRDEWCSRLAVNTAVASAPLEARGGEGRPPNAAPAAS